VEDEIAFELKPLDFYRYCEGYVFATEMQRILQHVNIDAYNVVRLDNLTQLCRETKPWPLSEGRTLVEKMQPYLKQI